MNEMIESRSAFLLPKISMLGWRPRPKAHAADSHPRERGSCQPDCGLQLHDQSGTDRFDDRRVPAFLTADRVLDVLVIVGVDVGDSSASDNVGNPIGQ